MTAKQKSFFHKPRTMQEIATLLFGGDYWAANKFQNEEMNAKTLTTCQIDNPNGKHLNKIIALKKTA